MAQLTATPVETRNVMVVGKTGAGKSTVSNAILRVPKFEVSSSLSSCIAKCKHHDAIITEEDTEYKLRVMDTVGLFDTGAQTNEATIAEVKQHLNDFFKEGMNLIIFVLREGRFTPEEKNTFQFIQRHFREEISAISALVITNCDLKDEPMRSKLIQEFQSTEVTKTTAEFMKAGIYTVGFPPKSDFSNLPSEVKSYYEECIDKDKKQLWELIKQSSETKLTKDLQKVFGFWDRCNIL